MVRVCTVMDYPAKKFWEYRDDVIAAFRAYNFGGHFKPYDPETYVPLEEYVYRHIYRPALWFWEIR